MVEAGAKRDIRKLKLDELTDFFIAHGEKPFRAKQVYEWLWNKSAKNFEQMTNLSVGLRQLLTAHFTINHIKVDHMQRSADGTIKNAVTLFDGMVVESVLIPTEKRITACVSSQVGCSLACRFCATARLKRQRNLSADEIYHQVAAIKEQAELFYGRPLTNIVFMGMGEPLLNYKNVLKAIERISSPDGLGMSPRRITVSTAGVAKMIKQLGDDEVRFKLAVSLHAATDQKRNEIMPINESNNLKALVEALNYFYQKTGNEITLEYILFRNFNDSIADADELIKIFRQVPADLVNIIEYNPIDAAAFAKPDEETVQAFMAYLSKHKVNARLRRSRGKDIDAACGQLANKANPVL